MDIWLLLTIWSAWALYLCYLGYRNIFCHFSNEKLPLSMRILYLINIAALAENLFTNLLEHFDMGYHKPALWFSAIVNLFMFLGYMFSLNKCVRYYRQLSEDKKSGQNMLLLYMAIALSYIALPILFLYPLYRVTGLFMVVGQSIVSILIAEKMTTRAIEVEGRMAKLQTDITISQIRPHFLYNCLNTIYYLCDNSPLKAKQAVADFSEYLRGDLESLSGNRIISFEKELEHTKRYLSLEKMRFEDILEVEYEIQDKDFVIPSLTLQPLVENAVKHGISKRIEGGTVWISSRKEGDVVEITVRDNGVGFDMTSLKQEDIHTDHIGVNNVKTRIQMLMGGQMLMESVPGRGTCVTITYPLNNNRMK